MSSQSIRMGMLSFAHQHAVSYAQNLQRLPGVEIVGLWNEDAAKGQEYAQRFGMEFYADPNALLDQELDGVIICSANTHHRRDVDLAAGRVRGILCEKPISTNMADGQAIIDRCRDTGTQLQIAFPVRFHPVFAQLKALLDRGELGRILAVECTNHGSMPGSWFVQKELSGGGAVIDHTVHVIDLLRWFWGAEVTEIYAEIGESLRIRASGHRRRGHALLCAQQRRLRHAGHQLVASPSWLHGRRQDRGHRRTGCGLLTCRAST
ncbi:MAG: Gfo/Idh/MocA family oxidoreductase [Caldilineaceae bacterium]